MPSPVQLTPRDYQRVFLHVTLEVAGEKFTSSLGPLPMEQGWTLFQTYLAEMKLIRERGQASAKK